MYGIDVVFSSSRQSRCDVRASDGIFGCVCGVLVAEAVGYRGNKQRDLVCDIVLDKGYGGSCGISLQ